MSTPSWFSRQLLPWYRAHHRALPWRTTKEPYRIWLSEVILQQTRVDQGLGYWLRFTERWPTVAALAKAREDEVLKLWQGLGYYSRARNLLAAARQVVQEHGGIFPGSHAELLRLKGVGDYTASAIASICFSRPEAVVDGNVFRVLARFAAIATPIDSTSGRKHFKALATQLLDPGNPGDHNQAVMELGAMVCTPRDPKCPGCPIQAQCAAFATGTIAGLPVKQGKTKSRDRYFNYLHIAAKGGVYLCQRTGRDIWQGLFEPPLIESGKPLDRAAFTRVLEKQLGKGWIIETRVARPPHVLSHQVVHAVFWRIVPPKGARPPAEWRVHSRPELHALAVHRLVQVWLETMEE
ncbi:MAG: A/G-specific adenine glycosylase [Flavobacteriales bacterium]|nr:A/G-specific adenine glycosylase [Flavobacteriales bacterium]MBP9080281.1 A/G-specific adenine glycosylase [Flavobacteriales bacterium]